MKDQGELLAAFSILHRSPSRRTFLSIFPDKDDPQISSEGPELYASHQDSATPMITRMSYSPRAVETNRRTNSMTGAMASSHQDSSSLSGAEDWKK
jgi:hypothetical protein